MSTVLEGQQAAFATHIAFLAPTGAISTTVCQQHEEEAMQIDQRVYAHTMEEHFRLMLVDYLQQVERQRAWPRPFLFRRAQAARNIAASNVTAEIALAITKMVYNLPVVEAPNQHPSWRCTERSPS